MKLFEYINSDLRLRLVLLLNCYEELTLKHICRKLSKSKVTITNHLKALLDVGILTIREEDLKGPLVRKYYSIDPYSFRETITKCEDFKSLSNDEKWEFLSKKASYRQSEFQFMQSLIAEIIPYWTSIQKKIALYQEVKADYSEIYYDEKKVEHFIYPMNEDEYKIYMEEVALMNAHLREKFAKLRAKNDYKRAKPHLAWHVLIPLRKFFDEMP